MKMFAVLLLVGLCLGCTTRYRSDKIMYRPVVHVHGVPGAPDSVHGAQVWVDIHNSEETAARADPRTTVETEADVNLSPVAEVPGETLLEEVRPVLTFSAPSDGAEVRKKARGE